MSEAVYGFPFPLPEDVDFVVYSNEDVGFIATLAAGTNDNFQFALPYPATLNLFDDTIVIHNIEFHAQDTTRHVASTNLRALTAYLSYLDRDFTVSWYGSMADIDDEAMKAQFAGPLYFGRDRINVLGTASVEGTERGGDTIIYASYFPPTDLDLVTPLIVTLTNSSASITLATNASAELDFTTFEQFYMRVWFTRRKLTFDERQARNMTIRFQRLDS